MKQALVVAVVLIATAAQAEVVTTTTKCARNYYTGLECRTTTLTGTDAPNSPRHKTRAEIEQDARDAAERAAKWESFCKPTPVVGDDGLTRIKYAHKNCDIGRAE
jgi:hypothetical protein